MYDYSCELHAARALAPWADCAGLQKSAGLLACAFAVGAGDSGAVRRGFGLGQARLSAFWAGVGHGGLLSKKI